MILSNSNETYELYWRVLQKRSAQEKAFYSLCNCPSIYYNWTNWVVLIRRRVGVSSFLLSQKCSNRTGQIIHSHLCMGKYSKNMGLQYACPSIQQSVSRFFNLCECSSHRQANICIHVRISSVNSEWDNVQLNKSTRSSKCYIWYDRSLSQTSELLFHCRIFYVNTPSS